MLQACADGYAYPSLITMESSLSTIYPRLSWAANKMTTTASGAGLGADSMKRCWGEYFERRHFYSEIRGDCNLSIASIEDSETRMALKTALRQTAKLELTSNIEGHTFHMSHVSTWPDLSPCLLPTILLSVTGYGLDADHGYLPARDTCGCAAHFDFASAELGAFREFVERQYLLRYWLTESGGVDVTSIAVNGMSIASQNLMALLNRNGRLFFVEISLGELEASIVLAIYRGDTNQTVRYCVGLSCQSTIEEASDRAMKELWQSYTFIRNAEQMESVGDYVHDRYHAYFLECNELSIADKLLGGITKSKPHSSGFEKDFLKSIAGRFNALFLYAKPVRLIGRSLWCVRVVCLESFLHMDNSVHFNMQNAFSDSFLDQIKSDRISQMVPFP